jgi:ABC-2 type transport system ATP-binding protein
MVIEVMDLKKTYDGEVHAVQGISFDVSEGEVFGLLGPNGAGKSTTVGMLTTTVLPTAGMARLVGYDVAKTYRARAPSQCCLPRRRSSTGR